MWITNKHNKFQTKYQAAVRFLTRAFCNVLYVRVGKLIVHLRRSQRSRTVVWGGSRWDGSWKTAATAAAGAGATPTAAAGAADTIPASMQTKPQLEPATSTGVILPETGQFLSLRLLQLWKQLKRCRGTRARVPSFLIHFTSVLQKQFAANDTFLREANSYNIKRVLALRNSRLLLRKQQREIRDYYFAKTGREN